MLTFLFFKRCLNIGEKFETNLLENISCLFYSPLGPDPARKKSLMRSLIRNWYNVRGSDTLKSTAKKPFLPCFEEEKKHIINFKIVQATDSHQPPETGGHLRD